MLNDESNPDESVLSIVAESKMREKKTITILFPISHIHEYFEIENLHSIPLISESSVTEPFSGGCALAGDLF